MQNGKEGRNGMKMGCFVTNKVGEIRCVSEEEMIGTEGYEGRREMRIEDVP
jgi:hypothetical protein